MGNSSVVSYEDVTFYRGERAIFNKMSLDIEKGKVTAILGPSGTGKTTLLKIMGGLLEPSHGKVTVLGENIHNVNRTKLFKLRKSMGMLFQSGALFTGMSVFDNVAFPLREHTDLPESFIRDVALMKLEAVGLRGAYNLLPSELSGGMARRVALARSIALDPDILMYDEPFTGQDPISMGVVVKLIRELNDALGLTSIVVTHDVHEVFTIADYVYILSGGSVIGEGTPEEIRQHPSEMVVQFVGGQPDGPVSFHFPACSPKEDFLDRKETV